MKAPASQHRGTTLVEALIAFLVLSLGLLTVSQVEGQLRLTGETARQRSEAVRLAQEDIEELRSFARIEPSASGRSYADVVSTLRRIDASGSPGNSTAYQLDRQVAASGVASARTVSVSVAWTDRAGTPQTVRLDTFLAANDPALSGALGLAPAHPSVNGPMARAAAIPRTARDLGHGRSAYSLPGNAAVVFLFDNDSGLVSDRCPPLAAASTSAGSDAEPTACTPVTASLLSGVIRFSTGGPAATDLPVLAATVTLGSTGVGGRAVPECSTLAVATTTGDRYLQYACIVYTDPGGSWSGETRLETMGWALGPRPSQHRACRYLASSAGSAAAATPGPLPPPSSDFARLARYSDVPGSLANENFEVIPGNLPCPA